MLYIVRNSFAGWLTLSITPLLLIFASPAYSQAVEMNIPEFNEKQAADYFFLFHSANTGGQGFTPPSSEAPGAAPLPNSGEAGFIQAQSGGGRGSAPLPDGGEAGLIQTQYGVTRGPSSVYQIDVDQFHNVNDFLRWAIQPVGIFVLVPISTIVIFFVLGILRIIFPGQATGAQASKARKKETRSVVEAYKSLRQSEDIDRAFAVSGMNADWILSIDNTIERLEREQQSQINRVSLLQGLSMIVFALAIVIGLQALDFSRTAPSPAAFSFVSGFLFTAPFGILIFASGFLVNQASKTNVERSSLRNEQNNTELLLLRSLSKLATSIDFNAVFESIKISNSDNNKTDEQDEQISGKLKDLAVISSYLNK